MASNPVRPTPHPRPHAGSQEMSCQGKVLLYTLSFAGMAVSMASVAWVSGDVGFLAVLMLVAALGHVLSATGRRRRFRWGLVIYPLALLTVWTMRGDLLAAVTGGELYPWAQLLTVLQVLASFNLRSIRTLADTVLLGLAVILLASERALSADFVAFLLAFGLIAVALMGTVHFAGLTQGRRVAASPGRLRHMPPALGVVLLIFSVALGIFVALPQTYRVKGISPLPSRLDLTTGRPASIPGAFIDSAPTPDRLLPSRQTPGPQPPAPNDSAPISPGGTGQATSGPADVQSGETGASVGSPQYATLGYAGDEREQVVMYVRSRFASFWRGRVLDEYDGRGWNESSNRMGLTFIGDGRAEFPDTPSLTDRTLTYVQTFSLKESQPNAIFTGYSPGTLVFDDSAVSADTGAVGSLHRAGASYKVLSAQPYLTPEILSKVSVDWWYLHTVTPVSVSDRVKELSRSIVSGSSSDYEKAARLEQYLLESYDYDLRASTLSRSGDVVEEFLFDRQAGYCAQFATAMAVMARSVGLPARVATGYLPGRYDALTGLHVVRLQDAHAWVEIKFDKYGWVPFDPTPRPDSPWAFDAGFSKATSSLQSVLRTNLKGAISGGTSAAMSGIVALYGGRAGIGASGAISGLSILLLSLGISALVRKRRNGRRTATSGYTRLSGRDRERVRQTYGEALAILRRKGYPQRRADQSPQEYAEHLRGLCLPLPVDFQAIGGSVTDALYNPRPLAQGAVGSARGHLRSLRSTPKLLQPDS